MLDDIIYKTQQVNQSKNKTFSAWNVQHNLNDLLKKSSSVRWELLRTIEKRCWEL